VSATQTPGFPQAPPTPPRSARRPPLAARRVGYLLGVAVNLLLLWFLTVQPGWRWLPFLTEDFVAVVGLVIVSLLVGATLDLLYVAFDPRWLRSLGEAVTAALACAVLARMWAVFPIDLGGWSGWEPVLRVVILLGAIGAGIGVIANLVQAVQHAASTTGGR
jgi:hypothetical protein